MPAIELSGVRLLFFKQKTAYELRISDWSSDVCSSDLTNGGHYTAVTVFAKCQSLGSIFIDNGLASSEASLCKRNCDSIGDTLNISFCVLQNQASDEFRPSPSRLHAQHAGYGGNQVRCHMAIHTDRQPPIPTLWPARGKIGDRVVSLRYLAPQVQVALLRCRHFGRRQPMPAQYGRAQCRERGSQNG